MKHLRKINESNSEERYFLDRDNSSHWYLVPVSLKSEWVKWNNLHEDDPAGWDPLPGTIRIGGAPNRISFTDPKIS